LRALIGSPKRSIEYFGTPMSNENYFWLDAESSAAADIPVDGLFIITVSLFRLRPVASPFTPR